MLKFLLELSSSVDIARRYFVTNGFDGALTMVGLCMGFQASGGVEPSIAAKACLGAGVALGVSGVSSAYISERAERRKALNELREAMVDNMKTAVHVNAAKLAPIFIAAVNGLAPFIIALLVTIPLWLASGGSALSFDPLWLAMAVALSIVFLLGTFLAHLNGGMWLWGGLQTLLVALVTLFLLSFL